MKNKQESEKVENLDSYFKSSHYEDSLSSDLENEKEIIQEEEHLGIHNIGE